MDILITGGAGFIGSNIARSLVSLGIQPRIIDNLYTGKMENLADISLAGKLLGYRPKVLFEEGVGKTIDWYNRNSV